MADQPPRKRYVFVCGLHRSGTTLITRCLGEHPEISSFKNTGVIEDEGQFLQSVIPQDNEFGGAGRFAFDPRSHTTEQSPLAMLRHIEALHRDWSKWWDQSRSVFLEKTPGNLLRMRLLQAAFEPAYFIIVTRHPIATALATEKWTKTGIFSLLTHWAHGYEIARADAAHIQRSTWISYEAFVADPQASLGRLSRFIGVEPNPSWRFSFANQNDAYFERWRRDFLIDRNRGITPAEPERPVAFKTRVTRRTREEWRRLTSPEYRRRLKLTQTYDALDAATVLEDRIRAFGYSFNDLEKYPRQFQSATVV